MAASPSRKWPIVQPSSPQHLRTNSAQGWEPLRVAKRSEPRQPGQSSDSDSSASKSAPGPRRTSNSFRHLERNLVTNSVFRQSSYQHFDEAPSSPEPMVTKPSKGTKPKPRPSAGYSLVCSGGYVSKSRFLHHGENEDEDMDALRSPTPSLTDESGGIDESSSPPCTDEDLTDVPPDSPDAGTDCVPKIPIRRRFSNTSSISSESVSVASTPRGHGSLFNSPTHTPKLPDSLPTSPHSSLSPSRRLFGPRPTTNTSAPGTPGKPQQGLTARSRKKSVTWAPSEEVHEFDILTSDDGDSRRDSTSSVQTFDSSPGGNDDHDIMNNIIASSKISFDDDLSLETIEPSTSGTSERNNARHPSSSFNQREGTTPLSVKNLAALNVVSQSPPTHDLSIGDESFASMITYSISDSNNSPLSHQLSKLEREQSLSDFQSSIPDEDEVSTENSSPIHPPIEACDLPSPSKPLNLKRNTLTDFNPDTSSALDVFAPSSNLSPPTSEDKPSSLGHRPLPPTPSVAPTNILDHKEQEQESNERETDSTVIGNSDNEDKEKYESDSESLPKDKELQFNNVPRPRVKSMFAPLSQPLDLDEDNQRKNDAARPFLVKSDSDYSLPDLDVASTSMLLEELGLERTASMLSSSRGRYVGDSIRRTDKIQLPDDSMDDLENASFTKDDDNIDLSIIEHKVDERKSPSPVPVSEIQDEAQNEHVMLEAARSPLEKLANGVFPNIQNAPGKENTPLVPVQKFTRARSYSTSAAPSPQFSRAESSKPKDTPVSKSPEPTNKNGSKSGRATTPFGSELFKELDSVYESRDRSYRAHEHETVYVGADTSKTQKSNAWRKVRTERDLHEYNEELDQLLKGEVKSFADGKTFFKVCKITLEDIPMPRTRTYFQLVLDNGSERVPSRYEWEVAREVANLGPEYEVLTNSRLKEITFSIQARLDPHLKPQKSPVVQVSKSNSALRRLFQSPKKQQSTPAPAPTTLDPLAARLGPNGLIGRVTIPFSEIVRLCTGRAEVLAIPLHSNTDYRIGSMRVKVFRIPPLPEVFAPSLPTDLEGCLQGIKWAKSQQIETRKGTLTQLGGDCHTWRRRQFSLIGSRLIAYNAVTKSPVAIIDLSKAIAVEDNRSGPHPISPQPDKTAPPRSPRKARLDEENEPYNVERSFSLLFSDDNEIDFFADTENDKAEWLKCIDSVVGKSQSVRAPWATFLRTLEEVQKNEALQRKYSRNQPSRRSSKRVPAPRDVTNGGSTHSSSLESSKNESLKSPLSP